MKKTKFVAWILFACLLFSVEALADTDITDSDNIVESMIEATNSKNIDSYINMFDSNNRALMEDFLQKTGVVPSLKMRQYSCSN